MHGAMATAKLAEQRGEKIPSTNFVPWTGPVALEERHARGDAAYGAVQGQPPPPPTTPFRRSAYLDYLYGEIWTREEHLTRRDRRIVSICCCAAAGVASEARAHLEAALRYGELTLEELQELVIHFAVYVGWALARQLDDLLLEVAEHP